MSKRIISTVKKFPGSVTFCEPLNLAQVFAIEDAKDAIVDQPDSKFLVKIQELAGKEYQQITWSSRGDALFLPAICLCVEKWELEGLPENVTPDNFPMTPRVDSSALVNWLWSELDKIYTGEIDIPNES